MGAHSMDYGLTETQTMIRDVCRKIAVEKLKPIRAHYDERTNFRMKCSRFSRGRHLRALH